MQCKRCMTPAFFGLKCMLQSYASNRPLHAQKHILLQRRAGTLPTGDAKAVLPVQPDGGTVVLVYIQRQGGTASLPGCMDSLLQQCAANAPLPEI